MVLKMANEQTLSSSKIVLTEAHCYHLHLIVEPAQFMLSHINFHIDIIIKALCSKNKIAVTHLEGTFFPKVNDTLLFMKQDGITYELSVTCLYLHYRPYL